MTSMAGAGEDEGNGGVVITSSILVSARHLYNILPDGSSYHDHWHEQACLK